MRLLVIGSGMMGFAAAFDMARTLEVDSVTLADKDKKRARDISGRINCMTQSKKVRAVQLDAADEKATARLMRGHDAALSAVPYFLNLGLARAAVEARCPFADLGGNNTVVRREFALAKKAQKKNIALVPDCGLSPGLASILAGELMRRIATWSTPSLRAALARIGSMMAMPCNPPGELIALRVGVLVNTETPRQRMASGW